MTDTRGASLRVRVGDRFSLEAEVGPMPARLVAVAILVSGILLSVPPIIRAARKGRALPAAPDGAVVRAD
ncbi:MAG: hypothetical protein JWR08_1385 [Enterovirga sp.]|jgi:hypothetical protein|nr:hypothetical protein [Enterovirga sp.]